MTDLRDELPKSIGPYRVLQSIARGGTGQVFEVEDPSMGEHLALKLLMHPGASLARFYREYEAMIRLNHPNIIRVYHFGSYKGMPWQTMELVSGRPVQAYIMRKGRPGDPARIEEVIRLGHDIATALHHIHRRGLIHRDLKSANLLVLPDGRIKLIDFGSVRVLDGERLTREGDFVGTFAYASPEQLVAAPVDGRSDLYSLGILLYRLCTGRRPFEHEDPTTLARMHLRDAPVPPQQLFPTIPDALNELILDLLAKRRDQRPSTGKEVARRLEKLAGRPLILPGTLELDASANRLVGREPQQAALRAFLDKESPGSLAVVEGLEGSGRETMLRALSTEARGRRWSVYRAVLSPGKDLVSVALLLRQVFESFGTARTTHIEQAESLLDMLSRDADLRIAEQGELLKRTSGLLLRGRAVQAEAPLLIVIEALHHAGPVVLEWLSEVKSAMARTKTPVLFATGVDPARDHARLSIRERFGKDLWVGLPTLDPHRVGLLVGALLHRRPPPPAIAQRIYEASGGLPSYIETVVRGMVNEGILQEQGQDPNRIAWTEREDMDIPMPAEARDSVTYALIDLPAVHRRTLEALALLDDEATIAQVASGIGWSTDELLPVIDWLRHQGWLEPGGDTSDSALIWRQRIARTVVRDNCEPQRRNVLEHKLARAMQSGTPNPAQVRLLTAVDRVDEALGTAIVQASQHLKDSRPRTALEVLQPVIDHVKRAKHPDREQLAKVFLLHARALSECRPRDPSLHRSITRAEQLGTGEEHRAELALVRAHLQRRIGHLPNYRKYLAEAWGHTQQMKKQSTVPVHIAIEMGLSHLRAGTPRVARRWLRQATRLSQQSADPRLMALAEAGLAHRRYHRGELKAAEVASIASLALFDKTRDTAGQALAMPVLAHVLRQQGRFTEAIDRLNEVLPTFRRHENASHYVNLLMAMAWNEVSLCRLGRAQECLDELVANIGPGEMLHLRLEARLVWGRILLASDQLSNAARILGDVCNLATSAGLILIAEHARGLLAEVLWNARQTDEARKLYRYSVHRVAQAHDVPTMFELCASRARVAAEIASPDKLFEAVRPVLNQEPAHRILLESLIAQGRHLDANDGDSQDVWRQAQQTLREMAEHLNDTDRSALAVHPWARHIKRGLLTDSTPLSLTD